MKTTINNVTIELNNDTVAQMKKAIEEFEKSGEIQIGEKYFFTRDDGACHASFWQDDEIDNYRKDHDNCLPYKNYTEEQAEEYFNKRDARRATETKLRKVINEMNKKDGFVAKFDGEQANYFSDFVNGKLLVGEYTHFQFLPLWRYSSKETAQFINENHADLLRAYLNG